MIEYDKENHCRTCKGTGRQMFRGPLENYTARCNFCGGHGTKDEEFKWFDKDFKERGLQHTYPLINTNGR